MNFYESKAHFEKTFAAVGTITLADKDYSMSVPGEVKLRVDVSGVAGTNTILTKGRIKNGSVVTTVGTITGAGDASYDISSYDEIYFECGVYAAATTPKVVASAFYS